VSRLQRWRSWIGCPALTRWAKVCRAYGAPWQIRNEGGWPWSFGHPRYYFVFGLGALQRAPAAAAIACVPVPTFTLICFGFASSRFGMLRVSTPF
jgi:hypothetical protein